LPGPRTGFRGVYGAGLEVGKALGMRQARLHGRAGPPQAGTGRDTRRWRRAGCVSAAARPGAPGPPAPAHAPPLRRARALPRSDPRPRPRSAPAARRAAGPAGPCPVRAPVRNRPTPPSPSPLASRVVFCRYICGGAVMLRAPWALAGLNRAARGRARRAGARAEEGSRRARARLAGPACGPAPAPTLAPPRASAAIRGHVSLPAITVTGSPHEGAARQPPTGAAAARAPGRPSRMHAGICRHGQGRGGVCAA
jgi:hypothetical protein